MRLMELENGDPHKHPIPSLIDGRTPAEYRSAHVPFAQSQPFESLNPKDVVSARTSKDEPLYLICESANRSETACAAFISGG